MSQPATYASELRRLVLGASRFRLVPCGSGLLGCERDMIEK